VAFDGRHLSLSKRRMSFRRWHLSIYRRRGEGDTCIGSSAEEGRLVDKSHATRCRSGPLRMLSDSLQRLKLKESGHIPLPPVGRMAGQSIGPIRPPMLPRVSVQKSANMSQGCCDCWEAAAGYISRRITSCLLAAGG